MLRKHWGMVILVLVGFGLRLLVAMRGHNYDFDSWVIVARIMDHEGNVYAETARYNYGPVWANVLLLLYRIAGGRVGVFRYILVGFLSLADVGILVVLYKKYGFRAGAFFFLNPVSIVITGYHGAASVYGSGEDDEIVLETDTFAQTRVFVARYSTGGELVWATSAGGGTQAVGQAIAMSADGCILVAGLFTGTAVFGKGEPHETTLKSAGQWDIFVAKYAP